ncbi:MAG: hypothetical protein ACU85V_14240 [Gammaproteobacteria bacterium]
MRWLRIALGTAMVAPGIEIQAPCADDDRVVFGDGLVPLPLPAGLPLAPGAPGLLLRRHSRRRPGSHRSG